MWTVTIGSLGGVSQSVANQVQAVAQAAANYWNFYIDASLANIEIAISFASLPLSYSDSATTFYFRNSAGGFDYYQSGAQVEITTGVDPNGAAPDITLVIDADTIAANEFYYGAPSDGYTSTPPSTQIDLFTVVLHEIAHGLGVRTFIGSSPTHRTSFDEFVVHNAEGYQFDLGGGYSVPLDDLIEFTRSGLLGAFLQPGGTYFIAESDTSILSRMGIPLHAPTAGDDTLYGYAGGALSYVDLLAGNDYYNGLFNSFGEVNGGDGDDTILGGSSLNGDDGDDYIVINSVSPSFADGGFGNDKIVGGSNGDDLKGGDGTDTLKGADGDDVLKGGAGADRIDGGEGLDIAAYDFAPGAIYVDIGAGIIYGGDASGDKLISIEGVKGTSHDDTLIGDSGDNILIGFAGSDLMIGGAGDDTLDGGELIGGQMDTMIGGAGADGFQFYYATSVIISYAGSSAVSIDLTADTASGGDAEGDSVIWVLNVEGSSYDDVLLGEDYRNLLLGSSGDDFISSFADDDSIFGGSGNDTLSGGDNNDLVFGETGRDLIYGDPGDDSIDAGAGADSVYGGAGADSLVGGSQADLLVADIGDDVIDAGTGNDSVDGGGQRDSVFGGSGFDSVDGGAGNDTLTGGADGDTLLGGAGFDILQGDAGDDVLNGGASNDVIFGNAGNDTIIFEIGGGTDTLRDFTAGAASEDVINLVGFGAAFDSFGEVIAAATQTGNHVVIDFGNGDVLIIRNTLVSALHADDFTFG